MSVHLSPENQKAFLTAIASFRAVNGSYDLEHLRAIGYKKEFSNSEWQECVKLYNTKLVKEKERNAIQRAKHQEIAHHLQPRIEQAKAIIQHIPEIVDVFLVNSFTFGALKPSSDIDLLVVAKPQTLWWTRVKLTAALEKAGIRRKPGHIEEQICLSFFITTDHLNMEPIAYEDDIHFAYWAILAQSLFGRLQNAWWQKNAWLHSLFPNWKVNDDCSNIQIESASLGTQVANALVKVPLKIRHSLNKKKLGPESSILITDDIFKFHNIDRRKYYQEKTWQEVQILEDMCK